MSRLIKGLAYWSLQLTGASILIFNYQPYQRQQKIIAAYGAAKNAVRLASTMLTLRSGFNRVMESTNETASTAHEEMAKVIANVCEQNEGSYARMGQVASRWKGIIPNQYRQSLSRLNDLVPKEKSYNQMRSAITETLQKDPKQIFDGFKTVPISVNLFWQTYRAVLLDNYREVTVKVMPPSVKMQAQYDIALIRALLPRITEYMAKKEVNPETVRLLEKTVDHAARVVEDELDLNKQVENVEKCRELAFESNSMFYLPYYFTKWCNESVIMRQYIEGAPLFDKKALQQLKMTQEQAVVMGMAQLYNLAKKMGVLPMDITEKNILIRKYVRPVRWATNKEPQLAADAPAVKPDPPKQKTIRLINGHQVVLLSLSNLQSIPSTTLDEADKYWGSLKRGKDIPTLNNFTQKVSFYKSNNWEQLYSTKLFLYEPIVSLYQRLLGAKSS